MDFRSCSEIGVSMGLARQLVSVAGVLTEKTAPPGSCLLCSRFQPVTVPEPTIDETFEILQVGDGAGPGTRRTMEGLGVRLSAPGA